MKTFALLCFLLLASACVFVARAEEETAVEEPKTEDQPEAAADEEQPEENDEEEKEEEEDEENDEENTEVAEDEEKRGLYYPKIKCSHHLKCHPVCRNKICTRKRCKRVKCGSYKKCRYIVKYRIVKYKYKIDDYDGYGYGPKYGYKIKKIPYKIPICHVYAKYCTSCWNVNYVCGKICHKVCQKYKKCYKYDPYY